MKRLLSIILILTLFGFCSEYRAESILQRFAKRLAYWWNGSIDPRDIKWALDQEKYGHLFTKPRIIEHKVFNAIIQVPGLPHSTLFRGGEVAEKYDLSYLVNQNQLEQNILGLATLEKRADSHDAGGIVIQILFFIINDIAIIEDLFIDKARIEYYRYTQYKNKKRLDRVFVDFILNRTQCRKYKVSKRVLSEDYNKKSGFFSLFRKPKKN